MAGVNLISSSGAVEDDVQLIRESDILLCPTMSRPYRLLGSKAGEMSLETVQDAKPGGSDRD